MNKKILSLLLSLVMLFSMLPVSVYAEPEVNEDFDVAQEVQEENVPQEEATSVQEEESPSATEEASPSEEVAPVEEVTPVSEETEEKPVGSTPVLVPAAVEDTDVELCAGTVTVDNGMDGDDLLLGYLYRISGLDPAESLSPDVTDVNSSASGYISTPSMGAKGDLRPKLNNIEQLIYDAVATKLENVARNGGTTEFHITIDMPRAYTPADIGSDASSFGTIVGSTLNWNMDMITAARNHYYTDIGFEKAATPGGVDPSLARVANALMYDLPYDLYWFWKTVGYSAGTGMTEDQDSSFGPENDVYGAKWYITSLNVTMIFDVLPDYAESDGSSIDIHTVDAAKATATKTARDNAQAIVNANVGKSDYNKLKAFCDAIKERAEYNQTELETSEYYKSNDYYGMGANTYYGDAWQLIYVFDNDLTNNVVCEGYSKAFKYLCDLSGVTESWADPSFACRIVTGQMTGGTGAGGHMWNIVNLGNRNYLVDVTNCDGTSVGAPYYLFLRAPTSGSYAAGYSYYIAKSGYEPATISFTYDSETKAQYTESELTLSAADYAEYSVSFSTAHGTKPANQTVSVGGKVKEPAAPSDSEWTFQGWYKESSCTNAWNFDTDTVSANTTLYAKWQANPTSYTVYFYKNDGTDDYESQMIDGGTSTALRSFSDVGFVYASYNFTGWNTKADGSGTAYTDSQSVTLAANLTLYAQWEQIGLRIKVTAGGTGNLSVTLLQNSSPVDTKDAASDGTVLFADLAEGNYDVLLHREGCRDHEVKVSYAAGDSEKQLLLCAEGDLNADGNVDTSDMQALFEYLTTGESTSGLFTSDLKYFKALADVNENSGVIDILDYQALYMLINPPVA